MPVTAAFKLERELVRVSANPFLILSPVDAIATHTIEAPPPVSAASSAAGRLRLMAAAAPPSP